MVKIITPVVNKKSHIIREILPRATEIISEMYGEEKANARAKITISNHIADIKSHSHIKD